MSVIGGRVGHIPEVGVAVGAGGCRSRRSRGRPRPPRPEIRGAPVEHRAVPHDLDILPDLPRGNPEGRARGLREAVGEHRVGPRALGDERAAGIHLADRPRRHDPVGRDPEGRELQPDSRAPGSPRRRSPAPRRTTTSPVRTGAVGAPERVISTTGFSRTSSVRSLDAASAETVSTVRPAPRSRSTPSASTLGSPTGPRCSSPFPHRCASRPRHPSPRWRGRSRSRRRGVPAGSRPRPRPPAGSGSSPGSPPAPRARRAGRCLPDPSAPSRSACARRAG